MLTLQHNDLVINEFPNTIQLRPLLNTTSASYELLTHSQVQLTFNSVHEVSFPTYKHCS